MTYREERYYPTAVTHAFERIAAAAKIDFTAHDLRRTFAGILANRFGVPPTRIRGYLGHESLSTTETYYVGRGDVDHGGQVTSLPPPLSRPKSKCARRDSNPHALSGKRS